MTFKRLFPLLVLTLCSCGNFKKNDKSESVGSLKELKIVPIYFNQVCQGDSCSYVHFLMLTSFDEAKFNDYDFIYLGDKYLDTVKVNLPVAAIEFCKPFNFVNIGGSENDEQIEKNAITSLWYKPSSKDDKVPEISHVSIWTNGQRKDLDYLHSESRRQRMEYYNSKK